jgi:hypothetical protein
MTLHMDATHACTRCGHLKTADKLTSITAVGSKPKYICIAVRVCLRQQISTPAKISQFKAPLHGIHESISDFIAELCMEEIYRSGDDTFRQRVLTVDMFTKDAPASLHNTLGVTFHNGKTHTALVGQSYGDLEFFNKVLNDFLNGNI